MLSNCNKWTLQIYNINLLLSYKQSWALGVFFKFFNDKNDFLAFFYQVNNLFLHQSYLKSPLTVKLTL